MRYPDYDKMLTGRNAQSKKLANHTYLHRRAEDTIALQYHATDVATFKANGDIILNSGGWHTSTTKERINMAIAPEFGLSQERGVWHVGKRYVQGEKLGEWARFADNMTLHANGKITGASKESPKTDNKLRARVKDYAQKCADAIPLDMPGAGDCWYCSMVTTDGESLGDAFKDTSHIDSHIEEGYIVPSLVFNALKATGAGPFYFAEVFGKSELSDYSRDLTAAMVKKSVYRFIMKRYGFAV